jgi:putative transposase
LRAFIAAGKNAGNVAVLSRRVISQTRVRTWALKGQTPVVQFHFNWHQLSLIAGMHFSGMCFRLHDGRIAKEQALEFLKALLAHFPLPPRLLYL